MCMKRIHTNIPIQCASVHNAAQNMCHPRGEEKIPFSTSFFPAACVCAGPGRSFCCVQLPRLSGRCAVPEREKIIINALLKGQKREERWSSLEASVPKKRISQVQRLFGCGHRVVLACGCARVRYDRVRGEGGTEETAAKGSWSWQRQPPAATHPIGCPIFVSILAHSFSTPHLPDVHPHPWYGPKANGQLAVVGIFITARLVYVANKRTDVRFCFALVFRSPTISLSTEL